MGQEVFRAVYRGDAGELQVQKIGKICVCIHTNLNISEIEEDPNYKPGDNGNGNNNPFNYPNLRDLQILKTSCLKCATYLINDVPFEVDKKVDLALEVAKRLEKYLTVIPPNEEPAAEESGESGHFDGEF